MNLCPALNMYGPSFATLLTIGVTMLAFSRFAKKHRDDTAYTAFVGVSLVTLANILVPGIFNAVVDMVHSTNMYVNALSGSVIGAVTATVCLMVLGKSLKVKAMPPKTLLLCFFVGMAVANVVGTVIGTQCHAPAQSSNHR